jgi:DNA (cytosine-5)-methyltransferase 1
MSDILGGRCPREVGYTLRVGGRGSPLLDRRNWDGYLVGGVEKRVGPREALMMQGFPDWFSFPEGVSNSSRMKQLGNSVAIPTIRAIGESLMRTLSRDSQGRELE